MPPAVPFVTVRPVLKKVGGVVGVGLSGLAPVPGGRLGVDAGGEEAEFLIQLGAPRRTEDAICAAACSFGEIFAWALMSLRRDGMSVLGW